MPEERSGIRSRLVVFSGAALGGVFWGVLSLIVLSHRRGRVDETFIATPDLLLVVISSLLVLLAGSGLLLVSRTTARTFGVVLVISALSGWIVFGTVAIQSWLWRL